MKKLEKIIKEAILEVLAEGPAEEKAAKDAKIKALQAQKKAVDSELNAVASGKDPVTEMARISTKYKIGDESKLSTLSDKVQSSKWVKGIIDYIKEKGEASVATIAKEKFERPQQAINPIVQSLLSAGILEPVGGSGIAASRVSKDGDIAPVTTKQTVEPEDFLVGSGKFDGPAFEPSEEEIAASFAAARAAGDSDDDIEKNIKVRPSTTSTKPAISDEEYDKLMKFLNAKERLRNVDSALRKNKRLSRGGDDMVAKDTGEEAKLRAKKDELEKRIEDLVASSPYLQRRQAPGEK